MTPRVALVVGPSDHGVVRHARDLAAASGWPVAERVEDVPAGATVVLDVTDRLWGPTAGVSGPAIAAALDALRARDVTIVTALHDVPFTGDGAVMERRAAVYRGIMQRSDAVTVCSAVERERLAALTPLPARIGVLPLPVDRANAAGPPARDLRPESVTVLGYLYPGKGHAEVLTAMRTLPADVPLVCLGRASDGHEDLVHDLTGRADRPVEITGFVPDDLLAQRLQGATIPVAPNRVVSASASIATWWAHGRRPLVPDVPYTREIGNPDTLEFYDDDLSAALQRASTHPASTWLAPGVTPGPSLPEVAAAREALLQHWFG